MRRHLFSIPPGAPFLKNFVAAFLSGQILPGMSRSSPPLDIARTKIYVPTRRAAQALQEEFSKNLIGASLLLPQILPLGGLTDNTRETLILDEENVSEDVALLSVGELERRFILAELILTWSRSVQHAVLSMTQDGNTRYDASEPFLVASTPCAAYLLARELAALIDEFIIEDIDPELLTKIVDDSFDPYWSLTTRFLDIALRQWPQILHQRDLIDASLQQKRLTQAQIDFLETQQAQAPIIAIGSTGAQPATARLLSKIASLENGAVVLPGLDDEMGQEAWACLGDAQDETSFSHPQIMLKRLLELMGAPRDTVIPIGALTPELGARRQIISMALAPAQQTAQWRDFCQESEALFSAGLAGVSFVEAADEREEALTLALFMRELLQEPDQTAILMTPDRSIANRVAQDLLRYNIIIDNSGGVTLASTPAGALALLINDIFIEGLTDVNIAALLSHKICCLGMARTQIEALRPLIEIGVLRVKKREKTDWGAHLADAKVASQSQQAYPAARSITQRQWQEIEAVFLNLQGIFHSSRSLDRTSSVSACATAQREIFNALIDGDQTISAIEHDLVENLFDHLTHVSSASAFGVENYKVIFHSITHETIVRKQQKAHPRVQILGPLEARLIEADLILIAGLDEGVWPPQVDTGVFLNRSMRRQLGMSSPERRIGQSAHDFMMAMGAKRVVLSRSLKRDGAPTVASRFITRIEALAQDGFAACRARGAAMQKIAHRIDAPLQTRSLERPRPKPALALRPTQLSVTRIEQLRRDPYAIYAEFILNLKPLALLGATWGAREIGTFLHAAISHFIDLYPTQPLSEKMASALIEIARAQLDEFFEDPEFEGFTWRRIVAGLHYFIQFEGARRAQGVKIFQEIKGQWRLSLHDDSSFLITAQADRIEVDATQKAYVFDYKTGRVPTNAQVKAGWSPQLTLEAAMIEAGAFSEVGAKVVHGAAYVGLKGEGKTQWLEWRGEATFQDVVARHREDVRQLLSQFRDQDTPYLSRPYVFLRSDSGDYDYLARVPEWSRSGGDEP